MLLKLKKHFWSFMLSADPYVQWLKCYLFNILIWIDQGLNVITGGDPDHTVSGRTGYHSLKGNLFAMVLEKIINGMFFDSKHCINSIEWDVLARKGITKPKYL